ncbi:MAG: sulfotransferase family protein [Pleurocapsa sp. SU_5_0]|nr:sulfotransferase family protein [Pleurocapsa sp. SU_5_0]
MILSHKYKFIFFCNGKTGSSSIEKCLYHLHEGQEFDFDIKGIYANKHIPPVMVKACLPTSIWENYFKFVFVRNPWDWFVSGWKYRYQPTPITLNLLATNPIQVLRAFKHFKRLKNLYSREVFSIEDIEYFFNDSKKWRGLPYVDGWYQSNYVYDLDGNKIVDFVGHFENLEHDFSIISKKLGLTITLPHHNSSCRLKKYQKYFNELSQKKLADLWSKDIVNFGYTFD